jgi:hypothetical protein
LATVVALCLCTLAMQTIGLMHAEVHWRHAVFVIGEHLHAAADHHEIDAGSPAPAGTDFVEAMFGGHNEDSDSCRLFDQSSHADLVLAALLLVFPHLEPQHPDAVHAAWHHATQSLGFLARGPPTAG